MLAPSDDPHGTRATALWSRDGGALLAFNEPFAAFFDFSTARLRDSTNMRWTQLGCGSFIYEDTRARVEESVWRLHCAVDLLNMGIQTDVLEPDVHLVSAAGRLKVCDIRLMRFVRNELAEPAIAWVISTLSERLPPPSPPVRPPVLAFDAAPAPAPGDGAPQPRGAGIVVKFPWKHLRPERKPRKEPRRRPRRFSALDLNYAHAYTGPCAPVAAAAATATTAPAPAAAASPAPSE